VRARRADLGWVGVGWGGGVGGMRRGEGGRGAGVVGARGKRRCSGRRPRFVRGSARGRQAPPLGPSPPETRSRRAAPGRPPPSARTARPRRAPSRPRIRQATGSGGGGTGEGWESAGGSRERAQQGRLLLRLVLSTGQVLGGEGRGKGGSQQGAAGSGRSRGGSFSASYSAGERGVEEWGWGSGRGVGQEEQVQGGHHGRERGGAGCGAGAGRASGRARRGLLRRLAPQMLRPRPPGLPDCTRRRAARTCQLSTQSGVNACTMWRPGGASEGSSLQGAEVGVAERR
jgi:hypothetical protein